ncbi:protein kinase [bacterium]|nr:protein kinase [bacterium]MCI0603271.1 protein kinase [bacterium]
MERSLAAGEILGHYRILSLLGSGGMGQVYLAEDTKLDRRVALKILPPELASDANRMRRFLSEAKSASAVKHPNVAHIYDVGTQNDLHFIAMEYIEGETLSDRLNQAECDVSLVLDTGVQVADALDEAHSSGIIHRDLKPANLMITRRGQVKILDFGLARMEQPQSGSTATQLSTKGVTTPGIVMGTVPYMSPEQVLGKPVDSRSDLFSFGVILYQMLTRRLPFSGDAPPQLMDSILHKQPVPVSRFNYEVPPELERIVRKCLEKNVEDRYQSAKELLIDLRSLKRESQTGVSVVPVRKKKLLSTQTAIALLLVLLIAAAFLLWPRRETLHSIAVLPFDNVSKKPEVEYLSEGIPEGLINNLSKVPELVVISRTSSFAYKDPSPNLRKIADDLKVRTVLTGRITQQADQLSISVELIDTKDSRQLWGEKYNRRVVDLVRVQEEITGTIVDNLRFKLTGQEKAQVTRTHTQDTEAYQLYLQGRYYWNKATEEGNRKAIDFYQQAIAKDPSFALAYAGLAEAFGLALGDINIRPSDAVPKARDAARKALELDDSLAEPRMVEGVITSFYEYDFKKGEERFKQAIAANPNYAIAHHQYAWSLTVRGRFREAINEFQKARQLDPLSVVIVLDSNVPLSYSKQYEQALQFVKKAEEMDPNFFLTHFVYGLIYNMKGEYALSEKSLQKAVQLERSPIALSMLGTTYAKFGQTQKAIGILQELEKLSQQRYVSSYQSALIYSALNRKKEAIAMLKKAYEERDMLMMFLKIEPILDPLRSEPEFQELYRRIKFD